MDDHIEKLAAELEDLVNVTPKTLAEVGKRFAQKAHPTLKQYFMIMAISFIEELSTQDDADGRDAAAVRLAKKIIARMQPRELKLPMW